jgi:hypothetical protein
VAAKIAARADRLDPDRKEHRLTGAGRATGVVSSAPSLDLSICDLRAAFTV